MVRIVGGTRRGMRLASLSGRTTRPTADRVKEALFNILADRVAGARVLDLFAGTGALGIEALSRGAEAAVFVERDRQAVQLIRQNVKKAAFSAASTIVAADVFQWLKRLPPAREPYDLIFADPPYGKGLAQRLVEHLAPSPAVGPHTFVVVEHDRREELPSEGENLLQIRTARYGDTVLTFYKGGS